MICSEYIYMSYVSSLFDSEKTFISSSLHPVWSPEQSRPLGGVAVAFCDYSSFGVEEVVRSMELLVKLVNSCS